MYIDVALYYVNIEKIRFNTDKQITWMKNLMILNFTHFIKMNIVHLF
jgi:hypothetical protein